MKFTRFTLVIAALTALLCGCGSSSDSEYLDKAPPLDNNVKAPASSTPGAPAAKSSPETRDKKQ